MEWKNAYFKGHWVSGRPALVRNVRCFEHSQQWDQMQLEVIVSNTSCKKWDQYFFLLVRKDPYSSVIFEYWAKDKYIKLFWIAVISLIICFIGLMCVCNTQKWLNSTCLVWYANLKEKIVLKISGSEGRQIIKSCSFYFSSYDCMYTHRSWKKK